MVPDDVVGLTVGAERAAPTSAGRFSDAVRAAPGGEPGPPVPPRGGSTSLHGEIFGGTSIRGELVAIRSPKKDPHDNRDDADARYRDVHDRGLDSGVRRAAAHGDGGRNAAH